MSASEPNPTADESPGFFGWRVCAAGVITQAVAIGFTLGAVGLFADPLARELGATATEFNLGVSLFTVVMNLSMPVIGGLLDRGSIRRVMLIGAGVLALSLVAMSRATALWHVGVTFGIGCAVGMAMLGPMASSTAMANWFDRLRGRALGIANAGGPLGPALIAPVAAYALVEFGWRTTLVGFAVATLGIALPAIYFGMIDRPADVGQFPDGEAPVAPAPGDAVRSAVTWETASIVRSRDFWFVAIGVAPFAGAGLVMGANAIPFMMHHGAAAEAAAAVIVFQSIGAVVGPLVFGSLADRIHPRRLFLGLILVVCAALFGLSRGPGYSLSIALFSVVGVVGGSMMPIYGALVARLFGADSFGQVMGLGALVGLPVLFLAPLGFGIAFDATGGYAMGLMALIAILVVGGASLSMLPDGEARRALPAPV